MSIKSIFDDLLPPFGALDAFIATHVLGWQDVRVYQEPDVYVGKEPGSTVESQLPRFTEREDLVAAIRAALQSHGYGMQATPVPEGWRVQVGNAAATSRTLPLALCMSVWQALRAIS
jgi:hypothetical protein